MSADGAREYDLTWPCLLYMVPSVLCMAFFAGLSAWGMTRDEASNADGLVHFLVLLAGLLLLVPRRLVRWALIDGPRVRLRTLTGEHEVEIGDLTQLGWTRSRFFLWFGQIQYRGGKLIVLTPAGENLMRALEKARPDLA